MKAKKERLCSYVIVMMKMSDVPAFQHNDVSSLEQNAGRKVLIVNCHQSWFS